MSCKLGTLSLERELEPPLSLYWTFPNEVATLSLQCPQMHNFIWIQGSLDEFVLQDAKGHHNYLRHRILRQIWILAAFGSLGFLYIHFLGPPQSLFDHLDCFLTFQCHSSSFLRSEQLTKNGHFQKQTLGVPQINSHPLKLMSLMMVRGCRGRGLGHDRRRKTGLLLSDNDGSLCPSSLPILLTPSHHPFHPVSSPSHHT